VAGIVRAEAKGIIVTTRTTSIVSHGRIIESPAGRLLLAASDRALTHLLFADREVLRETVRGVQRPGREQAAIIKETERQLQEYFRGRRREFDLPLTPQGTEFQRSVWAALQDIPWGETTSYGELAGRVGRPRAARAVGAANGANPISIIIPCHRVIGADRRLTGYGGGLPAKEFLLDLES
jgi:methylated-DNA-[protein]-cysteine S-methyltransferase